MKELLFQGDIAFIEVDEIPTDAVAQKAPSSGRHILAHSETGHHHTIAADKALHFEAPKDPLVCFLQMAEDCDVIHERAWDTHAPTTLRGGKNYMGVRQVERSPSGWQRVAD
jgi:hypothetical protein